MLPPTRTHLQAAHGGFGRGGARGHRLERAQRLPRGGRVLGRKTEAGGATAEAAKVVSVGVPVGGEAALASASVGGGRPVAEADPAAELTVEEARQAEHDAEHEQARDVGQ